MAKERVFTKAEVKKKRKALRNYSTSAESTLWKALKSRQIGGLKFRRQHSIGPYIMDFFCPELMLCIEIDGGVHNNKMQNEADLERTDYLNNEGITIIRFSNEVIFNNIEIVMENIKWFNEHKELIKGYIKNEYLEDLEGDATQ